MIKQIGMFWYLVGALAGRSTASRGLPALMPRKS